MSKRSQRHGRGKELGETLRLRMQRSSAEWPSILETLSSKDGSGKENSY